MIEGISDIESLALRCQSERSKEYIEEAIRCYKSGAYRASIVSTWIALVYDLIDKIRELALAGDGNAKILESSYETYLEQIENNNSQGIKSALEFEREILSMCKEKLQFFDSQQFIDLVRLREDRNRCAHPSFQKSGIPYKPSAEQARLHIRNTIVHVLSQPPVQGKAALAELKSLVSSLYFPKEKVKIVSLLKSNGLANPANALVNGFTDQLIFGFVTENDSYHGKTRIVHVVNAVHDMYPDVVENRVKLQINKVIKNIPDQEFRRAVYLSLYIHFGWGMLTQSSKDKIYEFVKIGPIREVSRYFEDISKRDGMLPIVKSRINDLEYDELSLAISDYGLTELGKDKALSFLAESSSWHRVNDVFNRVVLPLFNYFVTEDIERIIRMPTDYGADLPGAAGFSLFIDKVRESSIIDEERLDQLLMENGAGLLTATQ